MTLDWGNRLASGNGVCRKVMKSLIYKNKLHLRAYAFKIAVQKCTYRGPAEVELFTCAHGLCDCNWVITRAKFAPVVSANCHPNFINPAECPQKHQENKNQKIESILQWEGEKPKPFLQPNEQHCWESGKRCSTVLMLQSSSEHWRGRKTEGLWKFYSSGLGWGEKIKKEGMTLARKMLQWVCAHCTTLRSVFEHILPPWNHNLGRDPQVTVLVFFYIEIWVIYDVKFFGNSAIFRVVQKRETIL